MVLITFLPFLAFGLALDLVFDPNKKLKYKIRVSINDDIMLFRERNAKQYIVRMEYFLNYSHRMMLAQQYVNIESGFWMLAFMTDAHKMYIHIKCK